MQRDFLRTSLFLSLASLWLLVVQCTPAPVCGFCKTDADCLQGQVCETPLASTSGRCKASGGSTCFSPLEPSNEVPLPDTLTEKKAEPTPDALHEAIKEATLDRLEKTPETPDHTAETKHEATPEPPACTDGTTRECSTSEPPCGGQTKACKGICKAGSQTCKNGVWEPCLGEVLPTLEICANALDDDCDGSVDEGCASCTPTILTSETFVGGHSSYIRDLAFSPDGKLLASVSKEILLWNFDALSQRASLPHPDSTCHYDSAAFSPDGLSLATADCRYTISLRHAASGVERLALPSTHLAPITRLLYPKTLVSPMFFASASKDERFKLWDASTGSLLRSFQDSSGWFDATLSPDSKKAVLADPRGLLYLLDTKTASNPIPRICSTPFGAPDGHFGAARAVVFDPNGAWFASASNDRSLKLWKATDCALDATLTSHTADVVSLAVSPDGLTLASGSKDQTIKLWDVATKSLKDTIPFSRGSAEIHRLHFAPDGKRLAFALLADNASPPRDYGVFLWDIAKKTLVSDLIGPLGAIRTIASSPLGNAVASASEDGMIHLWTPKTGGLLYRLPDHTPQGGTQPGHTQKVVSLAFDPHGRWLASGDEGGDFRIWDLQTKTSLLTKNTGKEIFALAFSPDERYLAITEGESVSLRHPRRGTVIRTLTWQSSAQPIRSLAFSPSGDTLAVGDAGGAIRFWNPHTGARIRTIVHHSGAVLGLAFSPDGQILASASSDKTTGLFFLDGKPTQTFSDHQGSVRSVAFSPDGKFLISASEDRTVILRDLQSPSNPIATLAAPHTGAVEGAVFSPDGRQIASGSADRKVRIFSCACSPGDAPRSCYTARRGCNLYADGTSSCLGECKVGTQECLPSGVWGPCSGEVIPTAESTEKAVGKDKNCDEIEDNGAFVDLKPSMIQVQPTSGKSGTTLSVEVCVENATEGTSSPFGVRLYLVEKDGDVPTDGSATDALTGGEKQPPDLAFPPQPAFASGGVRAPAFCVKTTLTAPTKDSLIYRLCALVDHHHTLEEQKRDNNTLCTDFKILAP